MVLLFDVMVFVFFFLIFGGECFLSFCLFGFGSLFFFESAIHVDLPARAARGIVFSRFPRLGMPSGVTLVN